MINILIIRESDLRHPDQHWRNLIKNSKFLWESSVVILLKNDGTYQLVKNRYGDTDLVGVIGTPLDITTSED